VHIVANQCAPSFNCTYTVSNELLLINQCNLITAYGLSVPEVLISFRAIYSRNGNGKWAEPALCFKK